VKRAAPGLSVVSLWLGGCFVITEQDLVRHDRGLEGEPPVLSEPLTPEPSPTDPPTSEPSGHDTPEEALEIADALSENRRCLPAELEAPGDVDWYRFTGAAEGDIVAISTLAASADPPSPADTVLTSEAGASSNDSLYGMATTDSTLLLAPGAAVQVSDLDPTAGGAGYGYEVCGQLVPLQDLEPNDTLEQASPLVPEPDGVWVAGGWWDGSRDVYRLQVRPGRVYRASLLPGHALGEARLARLGPDDTVVAATTLPDYDDRPWTQGYPPDAGLMFREPSGTVWLALEGTEAQGPYALAIQELGQDTFPAELEPNDTVDAAQPLALVLQPDGSYLGELQGSLDSTDPQDMLTLEPVEPGLAWGDLRLEVVLQSASVGGNQDLILALYDPATGQQLAVADADPAGLLDPDPVLQNLALGGYGQLLLGLQLQQDQDMRTDPWFLTLRVRP
jgi:hypothetical protein